ncbi:MAG: PLP-dependent aminotransferase family protein [Tepidiformaceae bacterium]
MVLELANVPGWPAYRRLAEALRQAILSGRFRSGEKLPPTRALASTLGIARNTVLEAYELLSAEGYVAGRHGSGTFVAPNLPDRAFRARALQASTDGPLEHSPVTLSRFGARLIEGDVPQQLTRGADSPYEFRYGTPSLEEFPMEAWRTLTRRVLDYPPRDLLGYGPSEGLPSLREALARYLQRSRGVHCTAEQVLIVNGSQQALDLAARVLVDPGDTVVIEEPCYFGGRAVFEANGATLVPIACDSEGIVVSRLPKKARAAYVTPSHQFPTGVVMSATRRLELLAWAQRAGAVIIEDDYDSEFRYEGRPLTALQGLDHAGQVIYTGTLSKVLLPALRLGYMVAPPALQPAIVAAKWLTDRHVALLYQAVLALFIEEGYFERHLRRMRKVYQGRRAAMLEAFERHFGDRAVVMGTESGMHVLVRLEDVGDPATFIRKAAEQGVGITSAAGYYTLEPPPGASFLMGYSSIDERGIAEGIGMLERIARDMAAG